jgi:hypothetical protein
MLNLSPILSLLGAVASVLGALVPILITAGLAAFLWGLVRYLFYGTSEPKIKEAKALMGWGLVILFVMVSVWGIIELMQMALGINRNAQGRAPQILYPGASSYTSGNPTAQTPDYSCPNGTFGC